MINMSYVRPEAERCKGHNKKGVRCNGGKQFPTDYCGVHQDQAAEPVTVTNEEEAPMTMEEYNDQFWAEIHAKFDRVVSGTGKRSLQMDAKEAVRVLEIVREDLREMNKECDIIVMGGGAEGFDSLLVYAAIMEDIPFIIAYPNGTYVSYYWSAPRAGKPKSGSVTGKDRTGRAKEYEAKAYQVINVLAGLYTTYEGKRIHANFYRNQYMVDHADFFFVYGPDDGGTADCFKRIKKAGLDYKVLSND